MALGIAWLMEDVQKLTFSARNAQCSPQSWKGVSSSSLWDIGPSEETVYQHPNLADRSYPGTPPRPSSRSHVLSTPRQGMNQENAENIKSPHLDSTDGLLDEFTKLERAFRQKLAIKGGLLVYLHYLSCDRQISSGGRNSSTGLTIVYHKTNPVYACLERAMNCSSNKALPYGTAHDLSHPEKNQGLEEANHFTHSKLVEYDSKWSISCIAISLGPKTYRLMLISALN